MPTDHDTQEPPAMAADAAIGKPESDPGPNHTHATTGPSQPHDEASMRAWEGLPPDAMILAPAFTPAPTLLPANVWAMLVLAVDVVPEIDSDHEGELALFAGTWLPIRPPADLAEGDLVVRFVHLEDVAYPRRESAIDIEMLLAHDGRWERVGCWYTINPRWPWLVAPTASAVLGMHTEAAEAAIIDDAVTGMARPRLKWARGGVAELIEAGLVQPGDELVWDRRYLGERHTARVRDDGCIVLPDGRFYANPSGALTALGAKHNNGWLCWKRVSDGRTLGDLRAELRALRSQLYRTRP